MSSTSRKVQNPLLSAAGFGFESYTENPLLVAVTPATPAVLRDDAELDNFAGQESQSQTAVETSGTSEIVQEIPLTPAEDIKDTKEPTKSGGYFTSILSSLPNLSLSSIKGENSGTSENPVGGITLETHNPFGQDRHASLPETPSFLSTGLQLDSRGSENPGNIQPPPTQPIPPPSLPASTGGPISYRLGNQRRLKYAPPPDLTSASKQYPSSPAQTFFPASQTATPSTILNPNAPTDPNYTPTSNQHQISGGSEQLSRSSSLHGSFRSSPTTAGISCNPPTIQQIDGIFTAASATPSKAIPARVLEPATPQNTPANASFLNFASYSNQDFLPPLKREEEEEEKERVFKQNLQQIPKVSSSILKAETLTSEATFTPISAAKVSEKLEHLLAERKESPVAEDLTIPADFSLEVDEITTRIKSEEGGIRLESVQSGSDERKTVDATKVDSLTNVFLGQDSTAPISLQSNIAQKSNPPEIDIKPPLTQYYQTPPVLPSFFPNAEANSSFNYSPSVPQNPNNISGTFNTFALSPSSYFNQSTITTTAAATSAFRPVERSTAISTGFAPISEPAPVPQTFWSPEQSSQNLFTTAESTGSYTRFNHNLRNIQQSQQFFAGPPVNQSQTPSNLFPGGCLPMATAVPEPTGSATLSPVQMSVSPLTGRTTPETVPSSLQNLAAAGSSDKRMQYRTVYYHWFYRKEVESKILWQPFSMQDSLRLEEIHNSSEISPETTVATDGGRYDVDILRRRRSPVYWAGTSTEVRRCSWFFKGPTESRFVPYDESTAVKLEEEYKLACLSNNWNRRIDLSNGEYIIFHSATVQVHYLQASSPELAASWGNSAGTEDSTYLQGAASRPRVVKRGVDEFNIDEGEPEKVDHLLFLVHGIGSVCDLKFRTVEEVVDEFRSISLQLVQSHYRTTSEQGIVNRIEVLPISWHATLHSEDTGIDKKLKSITLDSIPKLRHFTNDTLLDILFYTSPVYCQTIMETVGSEMNRLYALFRERNLGFEGGIYLGGHSLGSLILFDLLCHQNPPTKESSIEKEDDGDDKTENENATTIPPLPGPVLKRRLSKKISYMMGAAGTGQPFIHYPQLHFHPRAFFALGSPIAMFVTVRGIDTLGEDFALPTCPAFFNIFHPFDPVAYRVESLINPEAHNFRPMLIPHHKGRKRMHLELKETMARVGADLKQKLLDSVRNTWNSVYQLALFHKSDNQAALEREIDKVVEEQLQKSPTEPEQQSSDDVGKDIKVGKLNGGRRIDYVLQEAPFEYINEYIFAMTSHVCYWESEDTMLMILKEIYGSMGIQTDAQLPQQTLSIERISPFPSTASSPTTSTKNGIGSYSPAMEVDPTAPMTGKPVGPPPKSGFVRKS